MNQLIEELGSSELLVAIRAEEVLIRYYGARALEPLLAATENPNAQIRLRAGWILGKARDSRAFDAILRLTQDTYGSTRYDAAIALGILGDTRAIDALIALISIPDPEHCVDSAACDGLTRLGKVAVPALLALLHDECDHLRRSAVRALAIIRDDRAIEPIAFLRTDPSELVRIQVGEALEDFGSGT